MHVFRILVATKIGEDCRFPVPELDLTSHLLDHAEEPPNQVRILGGDRGE